MLHPVPWEDHNDGYDVMSQDTVEAPTQPYTILRRQQNAAVAAAHNIHVVNEDSDAYGIRRYYKDDPHRSSRPDESHPPMSSAPSARIAPRLDSEATQQAPQRKMMPMAHDVHAVDGDLDDFRIRKYYKDDPHQGQPARMALPHQPTIFYHTLLRRQPSLLPYSGPSGVMPVQRTDPSMPQPFPRTTYDNLSPPVERHYLRISPIAMLHGSPEDVETSRLYRMRHPWPTVTGEVFTPYRVTNWNDIYCPDDQKRATSARIDAFRQFEAQLPHAPMQPATMLNNRLVPLPLSRLSSQGARSPVPNDGDVPNLLDPDESGDESPSSLNINTVFQENPLPPVQPLVSVPDTFQLDFNVPTGQHFSNEVLPSVNPPSSNTFATQFNSSQLLNPSHPEQPSAMRPTLTSPKPPNECSEITYSAA